MKKILFAISLLMASNSYSQCGLNLSLTITGNGCAGNDTILLSGAQEVSKIVWQKNNVSIDSSLRYVSPNVVYSAGFGTGDNLDMLSFPTKAISDAMGNTYVVDSHNDRVLKYTQGSLYGTVVAGGNGFGSAANQFKNPHGMCFDKNGNLYVVDKWNYRIQKFPPGSTSATNAITVAGNGLGSAPNQLTEPFDVFVDTSGNIFVCDQGNSRIQKFPPNSTIGTNATTVAGGNGNGSGAVYLYNPTSLYIDAHDTLYVADWQNQRVQKFPPGSTSATDGVTVAGGNGFGTAANQVDAFGVYVDAGGNIYVADREYSRVQKFAAGSTNGVTVAGNQLNHPASVVVDATGNILVASADNNSVFTLPNGSTGTTTPTVVAGGNSGGSGSFQLNEPRDVFVDRNGNIFVCDLANSRIQKFPAGSTPGSNAVTVAGGNGAGSAANQLNLPTAIYGDTSGNIYVVDLLNYRVQKFPAGSTSATNGITVAGGNGAGSAANQLRQSNGVFVDSDGTLYVGDSQNNRVQKFPAGSTSATNGITVAGGNSNGSAANQLDYPCGVFVDSVGNLYVADANNSRIQKFPAGSSSATNGATIGGGNGVGPSANQLNSPYGIKVDASGNVFVGDQYNSRIQKFPVGSNSSTNAITLDGDSIVNGAAYNQLLFPRGICLDSDGNIFIADGGNNRIMKWLASPPTIPVDTIYVPAAVGSYTAIITTASSCADTSNAIIIGAVSAGVINDTICFGSSFFFNNQNITATGTYLDTLVNTTGCDSILTLNLKVSTYSGSTISASVCNGGSYPFNGQSLTAAGTYYDTLSNSNGCDSIITLSLSVSSLITSSFNAAICTGNSYFYNGQNLTVAGAYLDTLIAQGGCDSIVTLNLTVNQLPVVTLSGNPDTLCINAGALTLTGGSPAGGVYSGSGVSSGSFTPAATGSTAVIYTYTDGNSCVNSSTEIIVVDSCINYNCQALYTLYPDTTTPQIWWAVNQATGSGSLTYTWYWGDGTNSTGAILSHTYSAAGNYNICLTITDSTGCTDTYCDSSTYIYKAESMVTVNVVSQLPTGINEAEANALISIYPNPATNQLFIQTNGMAVSEVNIYNTTGSLVSQTKQPQTKSIDISQLANGVYIAEIKTKEASVMRRWVKM